MNPSLHRNANPTWKSNRKSNLNLIPATLALAALLATGCSSMSERQRGTATGAGVGAAAGAVVGATTGGKVGTSAAIGGALGAVAGNLWSKRMQDKQEALNRASAGTGIQVARTADDRLRLSIPADFSFAVGSATIQPAMRPVLDEISRNLDPKTYITVIGHTDNTGGEVLNEQLAMDRASAVRDYLSSRGLAASHVQVQGRGEREPVTTNATDAGRAQNRRVEIFMAERAG